MPVNRSVHESLFQLDQVQNDGTVENIRFESTATPPVPAPETEETSAKTGGESL